MRRWVSSLIVAGWVGAVGSAQIGRTPVAASDGYVGAQACASCHTQIHDAWTSGRHSKMLQAATAATVKGDFSKDSITLRDARYRLSVRGGAYYITESVLTGKEQEHRIDYTLGSRRIQHYLTTTDQGWIIVLPPSWDVQRREWFHNMEIVRPDEDDRQIVQQWNKNCFGCHVSRQDNAYDPATRAYHTRWMDFGTSCERCHGPGQGHITSVTGQSLTGDRMIVRPTRLDPNTSTMVCAQCHSLRTTVNPNYKAGDNYYDFFVPTLEYAPYAQPHASQDPPYWADGRPRRFSNDAIGLWESACFLRGGATCTTCHADPHLPDIDRNPQLAVATSNTLCVRCHQDIGTQLTAHTRHRTGSAGTSCVECHMPRTVVSIKATIRDHTIGVPAPENTVKFGIPNACTECHKDKPASWAVDTLKSWWPDGRRTRLIARAEAFTAARARRPDAIEPLVAIGEDDRNPPLVRANAIGYLSGYSDPRAVSAIVRATAASHPAIRTTAIAALRDTGRGDPGARAAVLAGLSDPQRTVRIASLLTLIEQGGTELSAGDLARFRFVAGEFTAWSQVNRQDAEIQRAQGLVQLLGGDFNRAGEALQITLDLDPAAPSIKFFLAIARLGQRRIDDARSLLREVPRTDPYYQKAQEQLRRMPQ